MNCHLIYVNLLLSNFGQSSHIVAEFLIEHITRYFHQIVNWMSKTFAETTSSSNSRAGQRVLCWAFWKAVFPKSCGLHEFWTYHCTGSGSWEGGSILERTHWPNQCSEGTNYASRQVKRLFIIMSHSQLGIRCQNFCGKMMSCHHLPVHRLAKCKYLVKFLFCMNGFSSPCVSASWAKSKWEWDSI